jgi:flagellar biosynthesis/type III secretory pathway chaperone
MNSQHTSIGKHLDKELHLLMQLEKVLVRERDLIGSDPEGLELAANDKIKLVDEIDQLNHKLSALVGTTDIGTAINASGNSNLKDKWLQCIRQTRACAHLNMLNATLVEQQQRKVTDLLSILSGTETTGSVYDASGEKRQNGLSRSLGRG